MLFTKRANTSSFNGKTIPVSPIWTDISPRVSSKVMKPVVGALRHMGIRLVIYLDDLLILQQGKEELIQFIPLISQLFEALGLVVNQAKSVLIPHQRMEFLGFLVDTVTLRTSDIPSREAEEDPTVGTPPPLSTKGLSERHSKVCGETLCINKSNMASPPALQSSAVSDKLSGAREPESSRAGICEIQCQFEFNQGGEKRGCLWTARFQCNPQYCLGLQA